MYAYYTLYVCTNIYMQRIATCAHRVPLLPMRHPRARQKCGTRQSIIPMSEVKTHLDVACVLYSPDPTPLISMLTPRYPTAANTNECVFHRPIALTLAMSVNIDIRGGGGESDNDDEQDERLFHRHQYDTQHPMDGALASLLQDTTPLTAHERAKRVDDT